MNLKTLTLLSSLFLLTLQLPISAEEIDVSQDLRILELLPRQQAVYPLPIDPAVPKNFVAMDPDGNQNIALGLWWGPEEDLKKSRETLTPTEPLIVVKIASGISQKEYGKLDVEPLEKEFKAFQDLSYKLGNWGELPYAVIEGRMGEVKINCMYVGCNQDGIVYFFYLARPNDPKQEPAALALWEKFIKETKELPEPLFFKCHGQEMHVGHTISDSAGRKLLFRAEQDEAKGLVQISVEPHEGTVDFQFSEAKLCKMGANWHQNEDMVKIDGVINVENGWVNVNQTTSVLVKKTKKFSKPSKETGFHQVFKITDEGKLTPLQAKST